MSDNENREDTRNNTLIIQNDPTFKSGRKKTGGRAKGVPNKNTVEKEVIKTVMMDDSLVDVAAQIFDAMVVRAIAGDTAAAKIVLDRIWPLRKGARFKIDLPRIKTAQDLDDAFNDIFAMLRDGDISLEEAKIACDILEARSKIIDVNNLEISMLELKAEMEEWKIKNG